MGSDAAEKLARAVLDATDDGTPTGEDYFITKARFEEAVRAVVASGVLAPYVSSDDAADHRLGTSIQDMEPLDGCGGVLGGVAVKCGSCGKRFVIEFNRYRTDHPVLSCPYCSVRATAKPPEGAHFYDIRTNWGD